MTAPRLRASLLTSGSSASELVEVARRVVTWERPPTYWSGGRAGWIVLDAGSAHQRGRGLKLKGLGSGPTPSGPARPPGSEPYDRWDGQPSDAHFGIDDAGEFCLRDGDPAPFGGLTETSALREQRCSAALLAAGVPAVVPIAAFRYDELELVDDDRRSKLAVSVTQGPLPRDERCTGVIPFGGWAADDLDADELERLARVLDVGGIGDDASRRLQIIGQVYERFGRTLRGFADAGWFRYSGHPGNITIDDEGRAVLVDLDSCRDMAEISPERAALEAVRDGMSALYNLSCVFYSIQARRLVDDAVLVDHEPFSGFLAGWDPAAARSSNVDDGRAIAAYVVAARRRLDHFAEFLEAPSPVAAHLYRFIRHDRDLTFAWLFRLLARRRLARPTRHGMPCDAAELDARLRRFAGYERFQAMSSLERCP